MMDAEEMRAVVLPQRPGKWHQGRAESHGSQPALLIIKEPRTGAHMLISLPETSAPCA